MPIRQTKSHHRPALSRRRARIVERRMQEEALDEGLRDTFPASDPVSVNQSSVAHPTSPKTRQPQ